MRLTFEYSEALDELLTAMSLQEFTSSQVLEMVKYKKMLESNWEKNGEKIIASIEEFSNLKFKKDITCYPIKTMAFEAISSPFIVRKDENISFLKIVIIHELIHILLTENKEKIANYINITYPKKDHEFKIHIPVLLIQKKVMEKLLKKEEIQKFLKKDEDNLREEWLEANKHYSKFKKDIVKFLENENLE